MRTITEFIEESLIPAIYEEPEKAFGGTWHRGQTAQRCKEHLLTDGHPSRDRAGGAYIRYNRPYIIADGSDSSTHAEVIKFYQEKNGTGSRHEAARQLADIYGLNFDVYENWEPSERYIKKREKEEQLAADVQKMSSLTPNDSREAEYLRARGITDELRHGSDIFAVNEDTKKILEDIRKRYETAGGEEGEASPFPTGVARGSHTIGVPIYERGRVVAIYFRTISDDVTPKYLAWKFVKDTPIMFGLKKASPAHRRTLIVVEGVFDVIAAQAVIGREYDIAGYLSAELTREQARDIAQAGYEHVIQIVDYDGIEKAERTARYVRDTAQTLRSRGIIPLVVDLINEEQPDVKQDSNSFIQQFGADAFTARVKEAQNVTGFIVNTIARAAEYGTDMARIYGREDILKTLAEEPSADVVHDILTREDTPTARLFGDIDNVRQKLADARQKKADTARRIKIANLYDEAARCIVGGKEEAAAWYAEQAKAMAAGDNDTAGAWNKWAAVPSWSDMLAEYRKQGTGIRTGLYMRTKLEEAAADMEELIVPSGAMTFVTAPRGHGKTKTLQNMVLIIAPAAREAGKSIVAIHYEESRGDYLNNLISITANHTFSPHNRRYIREVMQREEVVSADEAFKPAYETIKGYYEDRTIIPISETPTLEDIAALAEDGAEHIAAIVVDYIQLVPTTADVWSRKDEIRKVCTKLNDIARTTGIPIITASQFNRTVQAPTDMTATANADASEIEQFATLNIGIWSSDEAPAKTSRTWYTPEGKLTPEAHDIAAAGLQFDNIGTGEGQNPPTLYMRVMKDREGTRRLWNVFYFDGNIGKIITLKQ